MNFEIEEATPQAFACLDESYQASTWYYVAACVGTPAQMETLRLKFNELSGELIAYDLDPWLEFHGYEIFNGEGTWSSLKERKRHRVLVYTKVLEALVASGCTIWISGVETVALKNKYGVSAFHPHEVSLHNLLDALDRRYQPHDSKISVIADNVSERDIREARMAKFKMFGAMGFDPKSLQRIEFPFSWMESSAHAGLQAADMALYIFQRQHNRTDKNKLAIKAVTELNELIRPIVRRERLWVPR